MLDSVKVSVIVPVYNTESHLARCLDSLVHQTLSEIEIIVVNDGSTDNSQQVIDQYVVSHPHKVKALKKTNGGLSDARNFGIAHATGEYLAFVDSDDWVDLDAYERLYDHALATESDVVAHPMTYVYSNKYVKQYLNRHQSDFGRSVSESPELLVSAKSFAVNKIYRRSFWIDAGFFFPVGQLFEDSAVIYNLLYFANKVELVDIPLYYYDRSREEAITRVADGRIHDIFKSCDSILDFYQSKPEYSKMRAVVEYLCLQHIFARFDVLARTQSRKLIRGFFREAYKFLDRRVPGWQNNSYFSLTQSPRKRTALKRRVRRRHFYATLYYTSPLEFRRLARASLRKVNQARKFSSRKGDSAVKRAQRGKKAIQQNGLPLIVAIQTTLGRVGLESFADSGTLLGLVREQRLLNSEASVDLGIAIESTVDFAKVRVAMERFGFKIGSEVLRGQTPIETTFRLWGIQANIHYYKLSEASAKTWLPSSAPLGVDGVSGQGLIEVTHSPINEFDILEVQGARIRVPANAKQILDERYGAAWVDPAAKLDMRATSAATLTSEETQLLTYEYTGGFTRSTDSVDRALYEELYLGALSESNEAASEAARTRRLQMEGLSILKEVDRVCRENDLTYYLAEGTLLGAIRHQGFIPWDDDIDIAMPRQDYEKFHQIAPRAISSEFRVEYWRLLPKYWSTFTKVRFLGPSEFHDPEIEHLTSSTGPFIDVFPLDSVPEKSSSSQERQKRKLTSYRRAIFYKRRLRRPVNMSTRLTRLRTFFYPTFLIYRKVEKAYRSLEHTGNRYWANLASSYPASKETFPIDYYGTPRLVKFEDGMYPVPAKAEEILKGIYGPNYLVFPELDARKSSHTTVTRKS